MSSLAAARADNFYFPPDWNPNDQGGKGNEKKKKKPPGNLGARAAKQDQGILVIRHGIYLSQLFQFSCTTGAVQVVLTILVRMLQVRDAVQRLVQRLQPHDSEGRSLQRREEGGGEVLLDNNLVFLDALRLLPARD